MVDGVSGSNGVSEAWKSLSSPKDIRNEIANIIEEVAAMLADYNFKGPNFDTIAITAMGKIDGLIEKFKDNPKIQKALRTARNMILSAVHGQGNIPNDLKAAEAILEHVRSQFG